MYALFQKNVGVVLNSCSKTSSGYLSKTGKRLWGLVLPLSLLAIWWLGSQQGWIAPQTLPQPAQVIDTFIASWQSGELLANLTISLKRLFWGFTIGALGGLLLGVAMGMSGTVKNYLFPTFKIIAYIPLLGSAPLLMIVLGIGETVKYVLIAKAALIPITLNTYVGVSGVSRNHLEVARVLKMTRSQIIARVIFPAAFPLIWSGIRFGLTKSWLLLVFVEILASSEGLGYMTISGQQMFQSDLVMVAVVAVGVVGFLIDSSLEVVERSVLRWRSTGFSR